MKPQMQDKSSHSEQYRNIVQLIRPYILEGEPAVAFEPPMATVAANFMRAVHAARWDDAPWENMASTATEILTVSLRALYGWYHALYVVGQEHHPDVEQCESMVTQVIDLVQTEMANAAEKFPWWPTSPVDAANIVAEEIFEVLELERAPYYLGTPGHRIKESVRYEKELVQTAAMAARFIANLYRQKF